MKRIIHRANTGKHPENTLEALKDAVQADADAIEIDVRLSSDGIPMVIHDSRLHRLTGHWDRVENMTAAKIKSLKVISEDEKTEGTIPTLVEAIELVNDKKELYVELKPGDTRRIVENVTKDLHQCKPHESTVLSSFDPEILGGINEGSHGYHTAYLFKSIYRRLSIVKAEANNGGFQQWHPSLRLLNSRLMTLAKDEKKKVMVWNVNDRSKMEKCIEFGVDGIITDEIDILNKVLGEK